MQTYATPDGSSVAVAGPDGSFRRQYPPAPAPEALMCRSTDARHHGALQRAIEAIIGRDEGLPTPTQPVDKHQAGSRRQR